jgi:mono/diheme cytochrome c family protein
MSRLNAIPGVAAILLFIAGGLDAQTLPPRNTQAPPTGNAIRGKTLYDTTLRCYACHGFGGQTGTPRLVPMTRSEESFITYLRKPATPAMPAFADVPRPDLVDVYAYIRSLPTDAPAADSIPLLKDLIDRSTKR